MVVKDLTVLSLFDGISCAQVALKQLGYEPCYYACEIDQYAKQVTKNQHPDTCQLGDIRNLQTWNLPHVDLLIGGSPCQDLSVAKANRQGLQGERSGLFYEYVRVLEMVKPTYFVLENVASMPESAKQEITRTLGVEPIMINAALVSAQSRKRLFWTNIGGVTQPADRGIILQDILQEDTAITEKSYTIPATYYKENVKSLVARKKRGLYAIRVANLTEKDGQGNRVYSVEGKSCTLSANGGGMGAKTGLYETKDGMARKLTAVEAERLQCLPDNYTAGISNTQRLKCLGNAFNVEVVKHILSFMN